MSDSAPRSRPRTTSPAKRLTHRERLLQAMIALCSSIGYPEITVAALSAHAGVSTASFYECFRSREACLLAASGESAARIFGDLRPQRSENPPATLRGLLRGVLQACERDPQAHQTLFVAALSAGRPARAGRRQAFADFERELEPTLAGPPGGGPVLDLPAAAVIGAISALLTRRASNSCGSSQHCLLEALLAWTDAFAVGSPDGRRSVGPSMLLAERTAPRDEHSAGACFNAMPVLPRGRHSLPAQRVAAIRRQRLIHATAQVTLLEGYASATVADIVAAAHVARGVFYESFKSKRDAFLAAQDFATVEVLRRLARAYLDRPTWPQRVWAALAELTRLILANPALAYLRLVACYEAGPTAIARADRLRAAGAMLAFEGFDASVRGGSLPELAADASAGAIFELIQRDLLSGDLAVLERRLPQLTYLAIAPFLGAVTAAEVLDELIESHPRTSV